MKSRISFFSLFNPTFDGGILLRNTGHSIQVFCCGELRCPAFLGCPCEVKQSICSVRIVSCARRSLFTCILQAVQPWRWGRRQAGDPPLSIRFPLLQCDGLAHESNPGMQALLCIR